MILIDREIKCSGRADEFEIYAFGDVHLGARGCAEKQLKRVVKEVCTKKNSYWFGGGDMFDCIKPQDAKRFDIESLPDWLFEGTAAKTKERLSDILSQQLDRGVDIFKSIDTKCLGILQGNHEHSIKVHYNEDIHRHFCRRLKVQSLTDEALIRLRFKRNGGGATIILYVWHGFGGGRTRGAEPNKLGIMLDEWECADLCFRGHSHIFNILPPKPVMGIPRSGALPKELACKYRWAANWGCWVLSHSVGPSTYASRAGYPARPMLTVKAVIKPFTHKMVKGKWVETPHVELRAITI